MPTGSKSFAAVARDPHGKQIWHNIGGTDVLRIDDSREECREVIRRIRNGMPAKIAAPDKPDSFQSVATNWLQRHVAKKKLRTSAEIKRCLNVYVYPQWADLPFTGIRRDDVTKLIDDIEDENGSRMADIVFGNLRSIGNWYSLRHEGYASPFMRGLRRSKGEARKRILTDAELKKVWDEAGRSNGWPS